MLIMHNLNVSLEEQVPLIKAAEDELALLLKEDAEIETKRSEIRKKITAVAQSIETLRKVYGGSDSGLGASGELINANLGITDNIRQILKSEYPSYLKPTTIKGYLEHYGFLKNKDNEDYSNPLALVHQILKRLDIRGEVEPTIMADGAKLYRWKPDAYTSFARLAGLPAGKTTIGELMGLVGKLAGAKEGGGVLEAMEKAGFGSEAERSKK